MFQIQGGHVFAKQKSILALISGWIGGFGFLFTAIIGVSFIPFIFQTIYPYPDTSRKIFILVLLTLSLIPIVISGPLLLSLFFLNMFPSILLSRDGMECQDRFGISKMKFKWNEIIKVIRYSDSLIILVVEKQKGPFIDGLYFNKLYALILGRKDAVVYLSPSLEDFSRILEEIIKNSDAKALSDKKPGW